MYQMNQKIYIGCRNQTSGVKDAQVTPGCVEPSMAPCGPGWTGWNVWTRQSGKQASVPALSLLMAESSGTNITSFLNR